MKVRLSPTRLPARPAPLLVADRAVAGDAAPGAPNPHFFPGPVLPSRVKGADYDNGGEGVAFHRAVPATSASAYRGDDAGVVGEGLSGLAKGDWARYSVDAANGGFFDLVVQAKGAGAFRLLSADRVVARVELKDGRTTIPNVYLNPGSDSLMAFVDRAGFTLDALEFRRSANPPNVVEAEWAARTGQVVTTKDGLGNVGQLAGTVTLGLHAAGAGPNVLRFHYSNGGKDLSFRLSVNGGEATSVKFPHVSGNGVLDVPLTLLAGANRITLSWNTRVYDSLQIDRVEVPHP